MPTFILSHYEHDIGGYSLIPQGDHAGGSQNLGFVIHTSNNSSGRHPKTTSIASSKADNGSPIGLIDWRSKTIAVNGTVKPLSEVKHRFRGTTNPSREWLWSGQKYIIGYEEGKWNAIRPPGIESVAAYTPVQTYLKKEEPAMLTFVPEVSNDEMVFLILAFLYRDLKSRRKGEQKFGPGAVARILNAVLGAVLYAVPSC